PPTNNAPLLNQRVGKLTPEKEGTEAVGFIYCQARAPEFKAAVEAKAHGTAQANVSREGILSIATVLPSKACKAAFDSFCKPVLDRILGNHAQSRTLSGLRDALLPRLLSGELPVKEADKIAEGS